MKIATIIKNNKAAIAISFIAMLNPVAALACGDDSFCNYTRTPSGNVSAPTFKIEADYTDIYDPNHDGAILKARGCTNMFIRFFYNYWDYKNIRGNSVPFTGTGHYVWNVTSPSDSPVDLIEGELASADLTQGCIAVGFESSAHTGQALFTIDGPAEHAAAATNTPEDYSASTTNALSSGFQSIAKVFFNNFLISSKAIGVLSFIMMCTMLIS